MSKQIKSSTLRVSGTHCRSCELIIEKEIGALKGIKSVSASSAIGEVKISYQKGFKPDISFLNKLFKDSHYIFSDSVSLPPVKTDIYTTLLIVMGILGVFYFIQKLGIFSSFNISESSLSPSFFIFGLLAGFSTCAALVGGIVLTLSRRGLATVISFNLGRVIIFTILGGLLGYFGSFFRLSITANAIITIFVSLIMFILGLQMLGLKFINKISLALPKTITRNLADDSKFGGIYLPALMGGLTFFLPCGFTLTTQSLALASGSWSTGALIMMFFSLGTLIPLILIGVTGAKSNAHPVTAKYFSQVAGILVLIFAVYNFSHQFNVLGVDLAPAAPAQTISSDLAPFINGKYLLKMDASSGGYTPNNFVVKAGQPIRWEITDRGTSGCTNAVISRTLFDGPINLVPGTTSVKEFTAPTTPGTYRFSCWMGMIAGTIEVIN